MAVKKISISLEAEVFEQAKHAAETEGIALSAWLSRAASEAADLAAAQAALAEYNEIYGEPDEKTMSEARAELDTIGFWKPETVAERDARLSALARLRGEVPDKMCRTIPFTTKTADDVGRLLARSGTSDVVDAAVVIAAIEHNAAVLTSDPKDIAKLASAAEHPVRVLTV